MNQDDVHEKIREEIRKRVIEKHFHAERKKEASEKYEALLSALEEITDLPPEEIRRIADKAREEYLPESGGRTPKTRWLQRGAAAVAVILAAGLLFVLFREPGPSRREPPEREIRRTEAPREVRPPVSKAPTRAPKPTPPYGTPVRVSIGGDKFRPVGMKMRVGGHDRVFISEEIPGGISRFPRFRGRERKYGVLRLGVREENRFPFAFDLLDDGRPVMYVDTNQNGDLTDDGDPKVNEGTGWFGAAVWIPFHRLVEGVPLPGKYRTWLFMTENGWGSGVFKRYSWTQLKGHVRIAEQAYVAYIADHGEHDADYTNDPIGVDLDRNGKIDYDTELFQPGAVARIQGREYVFVIDW